MEKKEILQSVENIWKNDLADDLGLTETQKNIIWEVIENKYCEIHRYYHNLNHIYQLLLLSKQHKELLKDYNTVDLSIFFHDIIYDPKSKQNEEESAILFQSLFQSLIDQSILEKVSSYIIATKNHLSFASNIPKDVDTDLLYFLDFDLSILGQNKQDYSLYSYNIRQEYCHVEKDIYCHERSKFLRHLISQSENKLFLTNKCELLWGKTAIENLSWEINILDQNKIPEPVKL